ncbi:helix-turn-helix domain-containing protein [Aurantimonas endophytica]|nr:helix-turn-helix domain-containing protein [Aurantimonas endophytica]MCO6406526.1 helix-turn-helix domain-containing protein [Aurantimonas endophytica]
MESCEKPLLTPAQAADFLAISIRQLRDFTTSGAIAYVNIGQSDRETRRHRPVDLEAFVKERLRQRSPGTQTRQRYHLVSGANEFRRRLDARAAARKLKT